MASANSTAGLHGAGMFAKKTGGWLIATALAFILLGIFSIIEPGVAGLAITLLVGWLLVFGGVAHLVGICSGSGVHHVAWQALIGSLYIVSGSYLVAHPLMGLATLTVLLAGIILAEAVLEAGEYFQTRGERGSGWLLMNALVTLLLSGVIWRHWPSSSAWAIGTLVGVKLLMTGISRLMCGLTTRKLVFLVP
jgi:uncharacterized membrane protein HdeD (DUF308 family)